MSYCVMLKRGDKWFIESWGHADLEDALQHATEELHDDVTAYGWDGVKIEPTTPELERMKG